MAQNSNESNLAAADYVSALKDSIGRDAVELTADYAELALDDAFEAIVDDSGSIFESIPFVKTAYGAYKVYKGFSVRHFLKKLVVFINEINNHAATAEQVDRYKEKLNDSDKYRNDQLEYLLIVIDKYVGYEKPQMLAALYIAYLDGLLDWQELVCYSETIDRLLPGDYEYLEATSVERRRVEDASAALLRLIGLGLMVETSQSNPYVQRESGNIGITWDSLSKAAERKHEYSRTGFGGKLVAIVSGAGVPRE